MSAKHLKSELAVATRVKAARTRARDAEATKHAIIAAALLEFAEKGRHGARVEEIAARTATSKHMIYYYFGSKDGLYAAALDRAYEDFREAEVAEVAEDYAALEPVAALEALIGCSFDGHLRNPHVVRMVMSENLDAGRHVVLRDHAPQRELVLGTLRAILERGVAAGVFRGDIDPRQFHMSMSAPAFHYVANRFTFGAIFDCDMTSREARAERRAEVARTMMARALARGGSGVWR